MTDQAFNRTPVFPLEKPLADDINQGASTSDRALRDTMFALLRGQNGFLYGSLAALQSGPPAMSVTVKAGLGWYDNPTDLVSAIGGVLGLNDLARYKPIVLASDFTAAVPAAPGAQGRIDLIEVRYNRQLDNPQSRQFLNEGTNAFAPATVAKCLDFNVDGTLAYYAATDVPTTAFAYKSGAVSGSPVAPATDTGYLPIAWITVTSGTTAIITSMIADQRPVIDVAAGRFLGRQVFSAGSGVYTPTPGAISARGRVCGGGGGGGGAGNTAGGVSGLGGGGASGVGIEFAVPSSGGLLLGGAYSIGAGGLAGTAGGGMGGTGGTSSITINGVTYTATGGGGGFGYDSPSGPPYMIVGGAPSAGSSAADIVSGDCGAPGIATGNPGSTQLSGNGGSGLFGIGGQGTNGSSAGNPGRGAGAGGSGGSATGTTGAGGAGTAGKIIIDEYA